MELSSTDHGRESRHHPRVPANFPIRLLHGARTWSGRAKNLSLSGLALEGNKQVGLGKVRLELALPSEDAPLWVQGEVIREDRELAVRFLDLDWPEILALARYVSPRL
jgi:hypothetical protein